MAVKVIGRVLDRELIDRIKQISGQDIYKCMQCGTCAGACPMRELMDFSPTRIVHLLHLGQNESIADSNTVWMCASCHECEARCPRGLELPKVMEAVRLLTLRENEDYISPYEVDKDRVVELPPIAMVAAFRKHTA